jgi:hypothetical protein
MTPLLQSLSQYEPARASVRVHPDVYLSTNRSHGLNDGAEDCRVRRREILQDRKVSAPQHTESHFD